MKSTRTQNLKLSSLQPLLSEGRTLVVGTLHDVSGIRGLKQFAKDSFRGIDLLEVRLDSLDRRSLPECLPLPAIATARHPAEGGLRNLPLARRRDLLREALAWALALDIELRSAGALAPLVAETHQQGRTVILSHHDFSATPTLSALGKLSSRAADEGADFFKVATVIRDRKDLQRLVDFQMSATKIPVVAMGMGPAGRFSRIVLCGFGAPLCYGWLGKPQVPRQWPALALRALLDEVLPV